METGLRTEFTQGGVRSRLGQHRADPKHQWIDAIGFAAPYVALAGAVYFLMRKRANENDARGDTVPLRNTATRSTPALRDRSDEAIGTPS